MLLQRTDAVNRRKLIVERLTQRQRLDLEACMASQKGDRRANSKSNPVACLSAIEDYTSESSNSSHQSAGRARHGIHKSACGGKIYGYYAKAGICNLTFCTRIQRDLADAVRDHIVLMRVLEQIRFASTEKDFPSRVQDSVATVMQEEGLEVATFFRSFTVIFSAQHWIGRSLSVHCNNLASAILAWQKFQSVKGVQLFKGSHITKYYTPEKAKKQWMQAKSTFIDLQTLSGNAQRSQLEDGLAKLEANRQFAIERAAARWRVQQLKQEKKVAMCTRGNKNVNQQGKLQQRFEKVMWTWDLAIAKEQRQHRRAAKRECALRWQSIKKRRWDGKEAFSEFERRARMAN
eukprot:TRINITY_DN15779_c0_g1_i1.p1 TRINITY_DN15779_c0_g1~~TRINITY_DN15779_c0_g1_i1.p1  ORF type:complete len:347 (-),score=75.34 TRINITY_DN15779_c0_g1_i1:114-1154(-)